MRTYNSLKNKIDSILLDIHDINQELSIKLENEDADTLSPEVVKLVAELSQLASTVVILGWVLNYNEHLGLDTAVRQLRCFVNDDNSNHGYNRVGLRNELRVLENIQKEVEKVKRHSCFKTAMLSSKLYTPMWFFK